MQLTEVRLEHFRNLAPVDLFVPAEGAVLIGANGQGKTSFLEAIHFLSRLRSFRGGRHADAIGFGAGHFRVEGRVDTRDGRTLALAVASDGERRRVTVDGVARRPADVAGTLLAVALRPEDLALVSGGPGHRREFLDELLSLVSRPYRSALSRFERVLRQRNELLRGPAVPSHLLETWDEALIDAGATVVVARAGIVGRLTDPFARAAARMAEDGERGRYEIAYAPSVPVEIELASEERAVRQAWSRALVERREVDRVRGCTTVGPHRDDLAIRLDGRELARFGSQGERRTATIALRLLEAEVLEADTGHRPVLLLDDVFSELDAGRSERLLDWLGDRHQRFVTSPRPLPRLTHGLARWTVEAGRIDVPSEAVAS